jgi:putative flippase GtrA
MIYQIYNKIKSNENVYTFIKQSIKFIIVGIINTLVTYLTFKILTLLFSINDIISIIIGYILGVINSFILNKIWTFKSKIMSIKEMIFFIIIFIISLVLKIVAYRILKEKILLQKDIAFFIGMAIYTSTNFLLNKYITFKK